MDHFSSGFSSLFLFVKRIAAIPATEMARWWDRYGTRVPEEIGER
jgi:hypothetical protein